MEEKKEILSSIVKCLACSHTFDNEQQLVQHHQETHNQPIPPLSEAVSTDPPSSLIHAIAAQHLQARKLISNLNSRSCDEDCKSYFEIDCLLCRSLLYGKKITHTTNKTINANTNNNDYGINDYSIAGHFLAQQGYTYKCYFCENTFESAPHTYSHCKKKA